MLISLKRVVTEVLFSIVASKTLNISQGSVATHVNLPSSFTYFLLPLLFPFGETATLVRIFLHLHSSDETQLSKLPAPDLELLHPRPQISYTQFA